MTLPTSRPDSAKVDVSVNIILITTILLIAAEVLETLSIPLSNFSVPFVLTVSNFNLLPLVSIVLALLLETRLLLSRLLSLSLSSLTSLSLLPIRKYWFKPRDWPHFHVFLFRVVSIFLTNEVDSKLNNLFLNIKTLPNGNYAISTERLNENTVSFCRILQNVL